MFAFLAEHRGALFPDEQFADLFPSGKGRPSMPASVAASILTLQTLLDLSDADTTERTHHSDSDQRREWYGDSAYGTGDLRDAIGQAGDTAVIKPKPLQNAVEGGFTVDDFTVDEQAGTVTCPNGSTRPISATRVATFAAPPRSTSATSSTATSSTAASPAQPGPGP